VNQKIFFLFIAASVIIAFVHFLVTPYKAEQFDPGIKLGQIAEKDIIAPFEFKIFKNPDELKTEQDALAAKEQPVYMVSENLKFNAQKNLDFINNHFINIVDKDAENIGSLLRRNGMPLTEASVKYLLKPDNRIRVYNHLTEELSKIFDIGIYKENYPYSKLRFFKAGRILEYPLSNRYSLTEANRKLISGLTDKKFKKVIEDLAKILLLTNIVEDKEATNIAKQRVKEQIPKVIGKVLKNEKIISKNQKVTSNDILKLASLKLAQNEQSESKDNTELMLSSLGVFLFSLLLFNLLFYILTLFYIEDYTSVNRIIIILLSIISSVIFTVIVNTFIKVPSLVIPYSFSVLIIAMIFKPKVGLLFNFFNLVFISMFLNWAFLNPMIMAISTIGGVMALKRMQKRMEYYPLAIYIFAVFLVVITSVSLIRFDNITLFFTNVLYGLISIVISVMGLIVAVPFTERKLNMATKQILLELLDFDNPLLKKMSVAVPGSYHHSLIVGNLAESAAEAIGANHLLARVGSYYHDIGKIEAPDIFIENNPDSSEIHDKMMANESALKIKQHIENGVNLARKHKLPEQVINILKQHHGTGAIKFFLNKARETNLHIIPSEFHYNGPKPQTKEAAIVMIADIVESTTKSIENLDEGRLNEVFDNTMMNLIKEEQLNEAPITLKEIETIKKFMFPIVMGVYRKRLEYPDPNSNN
jgi:cyclic-di-AMP phosphodiesterase PgpH